MEGLGLLFWSSFCLEEKLVMEGLGLLFWSSFCLEEKLVMEGLGLLSEKRKRFWSSFLSLYLSKKFTGGFCSTAFCRRRKPLKSCAGVPD
jgi:hypothetical protein